MLINVVLTLRAKVLIGDSYERGGVGWKKEKLSSNSIKDDS